MRTTQSDQNLILFTIGPVQRFIAQARKTEDLWFGSYILSFLNAIAIDQIYGQDGIEIVFPSIGNQSPFDFWQQNDITIPSFPNRFLAMSQILPRTDLKQMMEKTEQSVRVEFEKMAEHALNLALSSERWRSKYFCERFDKQVKNFLEIYWVISPHFPEGYSDSTDLIERRLASIKNCRAFRQQTERGRKCSLCGERDILSLSQHDSIYEAMKQWKNFALEQPKYCRENEALCAVCLTKRVGSDSDYFAQTEIHKLAFPSTSEVSTAAFKNDLLSGQKNGKSARILYLDFVKEVKKLKRLKGKPADIHNVEHLPKIGSSLNIDNIDGEWLFEESFTDEHLERYYGIDTSYQQGQIEKCMNKLNKLFEFIVRKPSKYYAIIVSDGDNMGKTFAQVSSLEQHTEISRKLCEYSQKVRQIVEEKYLGKLIYAGGDDVLALANLYDLLKILKGLRKKFPKDLIPEKESTASAGVCIAHCKFPLGEALRWARKMEKAAKQLDEKDALAIALLKHSGNISQTVVKWKYETLDIIETGEGLIELLKETDASKKFIYTFREVFARLVNNQGENKLSALLVETEFKRLIERATNETIESCKIKSLVNLINEIKFSDFLSYLEIINFITREAR